jgi:glucosylglycerate phosphorylase
LATPVRGLACKLMRTAGTFSDHLQALYGTSVAESVGARLVECVERWRPRLPVRPAAGAADGLPLTERDALLITYADQVYEAGATPLHTLAEFAGQHLDGVVSGIHLLPFYPWSSDDGFSVKDYYAVDPAFGTWEDIRRLGERFELMFDAVFNHMSVQSEWFRRYAAGDPAFRDFFVTVEGDPDLSQVVRPRALPLLSELPCCTGSRKFWTTFSADQVDLNFKNPEVLLAMIDVLLFYVSQGARYLRLDAIAFLWKQFGTNCLHLPQTHRAIQLMRAVVDAAAPGTLLITETNVPHQDNISYFGDGTNEAHLVYNFALPPLMVHTLATGDATKLTAWAQGLTLPSRHVAFFNFLASHDGIGVNPVRGILSDAEIDALVARTREHGGYVSQKHLPDGSTAPYELNISFFDALSHPASTEPLATQVARSLCAHAIQFALAGLPGIYFHSLFGSRSDRAGAETSGIPRRINREKCRRSDLQRALAEPESLRSRVFRGMQALLRARRGSPALHPAGGQEVLTVDPNLFVVRRTSPDRREVMLAVHNIAGRPLDLQLPVAVLDPAKGSRVVFGRPECLAREPAGIRMSLQPYEVLWVR